MYLRRGNLTISIIVTCQVTKAKSHAGTSSSAVPMETESTSAENHQTLVTSEIIKGNYTITLLILLCTLLNVEVK